MLKEEEMICVCDYEYSMLMESYTKSDTITNPYEVDQRILRRAASDIGVDVKDIKLVVEEGKEESPDRALYTTVMFFAPNTIESRKLRDRIKSGTFFKAKLDVKLKEQTKEQTDSYMKKLLSKEEILLSVKIREVNRELEIMMSRLHKIKHGEVKVPFDSKAVCRLILDKRIRQRDPGESIDKYLNYLDAKFRYGYGI